MTHDIFTQIPNMPNCAFSFYQSVVSCFYASQVGIVGKLYIFSALKQALLFLFYEPCLKEGVDSQVILIGNFMYCTSFG